MLSVMVGLQVIYQWIRSLRYYARIRRLYAMATKDDKNPISEITETALQTAVGGITDMLFYYYGIVIVELCIISNLLTKITCPK